MREIQASDAKAHLSRLLDDIERGETIIITRHGRAIARIIPEALADIKDLGKEIGRNHGPVSVEEIISSIHEGHKY